jgi:hypothetical protein
MPIKLVRCVSCDREVPTAEAAVSNISRPMFGKDIPYKVCKRCLLGVDNVDAFVASVLRWPVGPGQSRGSVRRW